MSISKMETKMKPKAPHFYRTLAWALLIPGALPIGAVAAVTDLANAPLANGVSGSISVKPNIAFVVDDSGSMDDQNMPDDEGTNKLRRCWGWYRYNTLAYNPAITYKPPFKLGGAAYSDGVTRFPDAVFTAAVRDGYFPVPGYTFSGGSTSNGTTDLSNVNNTPQGTYYYTKQNTTTKTKTCDADANYDLVASASGIEAPGVANGSAAAKTNYANWYSYYRRRAFMLKAGAGEAFKDLDESKYRVGLFFINSIESGSGSGTKKNNDLKIADFSGSASGTQRYNWYSKLYAGRDGGATPLRGALSRMGQMYAGQISGYDPVQYSCQQNFTILSTDGYWNTNDETTSYTAKKIDNSADIGNQDGGGSAAVAARATITTDGSFGNSNCYRVDSLTVNVGGAAVELLNSPPVSPSCSGNASGRASNFGQAVRDSINSKTATTGFSASFSGSTITINAPTSLGNFTATPTMSWTKVGGTSTEDYTITAFGSGANAVAGAGRPYLDVFNASNTLADVAYYYYNTDLRDSSTLNNCSNTIGGTTYNGLCDDNVLGGGNDQNRKQHMTTFTVGLGVSGSITYETNYETAANIAGVTQYYDIVNASADWPNPITNTTTARIDDLWHAAVNGHGVYYSAANAETLKDGLQAALAGVQARTGSSAAAATSNLEPVAGDNYVYVALYRTQNWDGDLKAFSIDPATGALSGSELWSAQSKLDAQVAAAGASADGRTIKFFSSGATNKLKDFTESNLTADSLTANFSNICNKTPAIEQCATLSSSQVTAANTAQNLINYLRGQSDYEDEAGNATAANKIYRGREHVLGDTVNAVPVYMKKPPFSYDAYDSTYATFKTNNADRAPTVFIAANDGMLHAINATSDSASADYANRGKERWAYVPKLVMPNMWKLADTNYADNHQYFVDGSPTVADICTSLQASNRQMCASATNWKTILVGGLNKGGCGYYALDVTDPAAPKGLWEFTNDNLGYSYGNPIVGKRKDGKWVVIFTSGYNNYSGNGCGSTGDGNGHVFVVDAATGALLNDIVTYTSGSTPAGSTSTPSGLAKLNAWIDNASLPIIDRLYGGDMLGNLWRIDFDDNYPPNSSGGREAVLLAQLTNGTAAQPISTKPELAEITSGGATYSVVFVGTGKYLGTGDINDTNQQSIYAIKDTLGSSGIGPVRGTGSNMVARTLTETTGTTGSLSGVTIRRVAGTDMNWATKDGWYIDLNPGNASPGERVNVDMSLQFNNLTVAANVPSNNACDVGGHAYLYFLDIYTGKNLTTAVDGMAGKLLSGNALVAGIKTLKLTSGKTVSVVTDTAGGVTSEDNPSATGGGAGTARRTTWREIPD
jgi:type IV pilus assembly protein PilY1